MALCQMRAHAPSGRMTNQNGQLNSDRSPMIMRYDVAPFGIIVDEAYYRLFAVTVTLGRPNE